MSQQAPQFKILVVDDEWESPIVTAVVRRLEREGWETIVVKPDSYQWSVGEEFQAAALYAVEAERPDGVLLDVRSEKTKKNAFKDWPSLGK